MKVTPQNNQASVSCLCCQVAQQQIQPPGGIIFKNEAANLTHVTDVDVPGYVIAAPIRHVESWSELQAEEAQQLMRVIHGATKILESLDEVDRVYVCVFAEQTKHLHVHILPRYQWLLQLEDVYSNDIPDGPKIFIKAREHYLRKAGKLAHPQLLDVIAALKNGLKPN